MPREGYPRAIRADLQDPEEHKRRKRASKENIVSARGMKHIRGDEP